MLGFAKLLCFFTLNSSGMPASSFTAGSGWQQAPLPAASDLLKPFFVYLQFIFVVASMQGIDWPVTMAAPLQGLTWLFSSSTPHALSWECIMSKDGVIPVPVKVLALSLAMPPVLLVVVLVIESLRAFLRTKRRRLPLSAALSTEWQQLVAHGIVLSFLFYPMLLHEVLGLFACIPLDRAVAAPYEAGAIGSFWAGDMSQQCWQGYHRTVALALGIPFTVLLVVLMPGATLVFLLCNRQSLYHSTFQHFSFLFHMYKPSMFFWQAVVMLQTAVLVTISTFGFGIGTYYACLALNSVLALTMVLHAWARPYANAAVGDTALRGLACVCFTSFAALSFLPPGVPYGQEGVNHTYAMVAGAVVLIINVAYVASVGVQLLRLVDWVRLTIVVRKVLSRFGFGSWPQAPKTSAQITMQSSQSALRQPRLPHEEPQETARG
jgi:hypothetical protein